MPTEVTKVSGHVGKKPATMARIVGYLTVPINLYAILVMLFPWWILTLPWAWLAFHGLLVSKPQKDGFFRFGVLLGLATWAFPILVFPFVQVLGLLVSRRP